jgi:CDP-paratose 2-epimerase
LRELAGYRHWDIDIRDQPRVDEIFAHYGAAIALVVHAAAQPSHDWAAREPLTDFSVNATGTLILLEAVRRHCPDAVFIFTSTNKVYGDASNRLPFVELETRWELDPSHAYAVHGIDEAFSIDQSLHSVFGGGKLSADVMTQEYGRYFGLQTGIFRCGCITGPDHAGAELHGFLSYLVKCTVRQRPYVIHGYGGKQVRDNIHAYDLVNAFWHFAQAPRPGAVYNLGGSRHSNCSVLEAIRDVEELSGHRLDWTLSEQARSGDHLWWISDVRKFQRDYPDWHYRYNHKAILAELIAAVSTRQG